MLPNPDPILRRLGKRDEVYDDIESDAHVIGELQLVRADLLRYAHTLNPGGESRKDKRAFELCQRLLSSQPAPMTHWPDIFWQIGVAPFRGQSVIEIVWERSGDELMPSQLLQRPNRRFGYSPENALRLLTRDQPVEGEPTDLLYFLVNRHMPTFDNPYGLALFSSCYWPRLFKANGYRWFVRFCERFGIPFAVGKYPAGSGEPEIAKLDSALEALIEAGWASMQEGGSVELLQAQGAAGGGKLAQHLLVEASNAEMSKALTSQTLSTEQTGSTGSRAASETARGRTDDVSAARREAIAYTLDALWRHITLVNLGPDAKPPTSEFASEEAANKERAETYDVFIKAGGKPSRKAMAADLGITLANPNDPDDQMQAPAPAATPGAPPTPEPGSEFARRDDEIEPDQAALDAGIEQLLGSNPGELLKPMLKPLMKMARDKPDALLGRLAELYPEMDSTVLYEQLFRGMFAAELWGKLSAQQQ
ncbi:phage portal protein family protein [Hydrocarboniphaga effusa]|uniref:phage portal protein family protein n=1 Tax=Hydrocarboniphaga effusa TaxID=243629 RepID=UPI003BA9C363